MAAPVRPLKGGLEPANTSSEAAHAVRLQKCWRGARARRVWTDLLLQSTVAALQSTSSSTLGTGDDDTEQLQYRSCSAVLSSASLDEGPSLEEARAMAQEAARSAMHGMNGSSPHSCDPAQRPCDRSVPAVELPCGSCDRSDNALSPCEQPEEASSNTGGPTSVFVPQEEPDTGVGALHFTAESAKGMSLKELRELMGVLMRLTINRNAVLVDLLQKRDELLHEREYREQLVQQLLAQVNNSQALRGKKKSISAASIRAK
eukprot:scaffold29082_cov40-Tisochrysis_lutea.AAC.1